MRILADVLVARLLGLDARDLRDILTSCDHARAHGDVRGFWRVDKDRDPELRHTVLAMVAFDELGAKLECEPNGATSLEDAQVQGWLLPDELRLADYSLGQDGRALHPQPVSSRLGPRFLDWQLLQNTEESWQECKLHTRNLLGDQGDEPQPQYPHGDDVPAFEAHGGFQLPAEAKHRTPEVSAPMVAETRTRSETTSRQKDGQVDLFE